jgi:hypothetical protein
VYRCPVCNSNLADLGPASEQESHVKHCLDGGSGTTPQAAKYLVYKLPAESALIGVECVICLEEFAKGISHALRHELRVSYFLFRLTGGPPQLPVQFPQWFVSPIETFGPSSFHVFFSLPIVLVATWKKLPRPCSLNLKAPCQPRTHIIVRCSLPRSTSPLIIVTYNIKWNITSTSLTK